MKYSKLIINKADCYRLADPICCGASNYIIVNLDGTKDCIELVELTESYIYNFEDDEQDLTGRQDWERDLIKEEMRLRDIVESWSKWCRLQRPESWKSFRWMEDFVDEMVDEHDVSAIRQLSRAIGGRGTFGRFIEAARRTSYLELWYKYRDDKQAQYIASELEDHGFTVVDVGGKPLKSLNEVSFL